MLQIREEDLTVVAATHGRGLATATWDIFTSLKEHDETSRLAMYPNPTTGSFRIEADTHTPGTLTVSVYNTAGQVVYIQKIMTKAGHVQKTVNLQGLPAGEYIVTLEGEGMHRSGKLLIKR